MNIVDLESLEGLPVSYIEELKKCNSIFYHHAFMDYIRNEPEVLAVIRRIDKYCAENMVVGYHYTRALSEDLLKSGLQPRSGHEIRSQFLERFGKRFSEQQIAAIKDVWERCYDENMQRIRDNRIFFNFTKQALGNAGSELLLKYYGGEQVYFYIDELPGVGEILLSIGQSFVVKCCLIPAEVKTFLEYPWGEIAVSSYHCIVNPDAYQVDQDGYQYMPVPPERIKLLNIEYSKVAQFDIQ